MNDIWGDALDVVMEEVGKMTPDEIQEAVKNIRNTEFAEMMKDVSCFINSFDNGIVTQ